MRVYLARLCAVLGAVPPAFSNIRANDHVKENKFPKCATAPPFLHFACADNFCLAQPSSVHMNIIHGYVVVLVVGFRVLLLGLPHGCYAKGALGHDDLQLDTTATVEGSQKK